jgi:hypothetical protein
MGMEVGDRAGSLHLLFPYDLSLKPPAQSAREPDARKPQAFDVTRPHARFGKPGIMVLPVKLIESVFHHHAEINVGPAECPRAAGVVCDAGARGSRIAKSGCSSLGESSALRRARPSPRNSESV